LAQSLSAKTTGERVSESEILRELPAGKELIENPDRGLRPTVSEIPTHNL
jgi:hypothetical protein